MSRYGHIDKNMEPTYTEHEGTISFPVPGAPQGIAEEAPGDHQMRQIAELHLSDSWTALKFPPTFG